MVTTACSEDDFYTPDPNDSEDVQINKMVHHYLGEKYLWNDEYNTLTPAYEQGYEEFLTNNLLSLTTNTLDKKADENGNFSLYSYIEKRNVVTSESSDDGQAVARTEKELEYSFGFTGFTAVALGSEEARKIYFCVQGVYPGSLAERAGFKRGDMIDRCNETLTNDNYKDIYLQLLQPSAAITMTIGKSELRDGTLVESGEVTLTAEAAYINPVVYTQVQQAGSHTVGYLVYDNFDAGFDQELYDAFAAFRTQGVTDLVLDLRYNRGGRTSTANLMASCIAGQNAQGKVFTSLRFNASRMKKRDGKREETAFAYPSYSDLGADVSAAALNLSQVYVLVGGHTASASELVINALRGIGIDVVLVGVQTEGKNVGMEYKDLTASSGNVYRVLPITFQTYNALGESNYEQGFTPTIALSETAPDGSDSTFYVHRPYGTAAEPLYAKAFELITGELPVQAKPSRLREKAMALPARQLALPVVQRPGREGIIK